MGVIPAYSVFLVFITVLFAPLSSGNRPDFDRETFIQMLFLPFDTPVGSVIFRVRATDNEKDNDYPLTFTCGDAQPMVRFVSISGTDADMILDRPLQKGEIYRVQIQVTDTAFERNVFQLRLNATAATYSPSLVFTSYPRWPLVIREDVSVDYVIGSVTVRRNPDASQFPSLRLSDTTKFKLKTSFGSSNEMIGQIILNQPLDYERKNVYILNITCLNGYIEKGLDIRNVVTVTIVIVVEDVQDSTPIFSEKSSITRVAADANEGTKVMTVTAKDGDGSGTQEISYKLQGKHSDYFQINKKTGVITVAKPLREIVTGCQDKPIILHVAAEEDGVASAFRSTKEYVILVDKTKIANQPPKFSSLTYSASVNEHSLIFTPINFVEQPHVYDEAKCSVMKLTIRNTDHLQANEIFDVKPSVVVHEGDFVVYVRNSTLLDYERFQNITFQVVATDSEFSSVRNVTTVTVTVNDINDNFPIFTQESYIARIPEDIRDGMLIIQVSAEDADTGQSAKIRYTNLTGPQEVIQSLKLDAETGSIYYSGNSQVFDRETQPEHLITVEARDLNGKGNANRAEVHIVLTDVNDNAPAFPRESYYVCLPAGMRRNQNFFNVWAVDLDEPNTPNSAIRYEIMSGNNKFFSISPRGDLSLVGDPSQLTNPTVLIIRATDGGDRPQSQQVAVNIFTKGGNCKKVEYLVAAEKSNVDSNKDNMERLLTDLNGGSLTNIDLVETIKNGQNNITSSQYNADEKDRPRTKIVTTVVQHEDHSVVDLTALSRYNK